MVNGYIYDNYIARTVKILDWKDTITKGKTLMDSLYTLASYIHKDKFLNAQIQQVYINSDREIELIPYIGKQTILLGDISDMDTKFHNLVLFYKKAISRSGWSTYNYINLKYKNQIVCTKTNK
jgi:cell division protein FtsQ